MLGIMGTIGIRTGLSYTIYARVLDMTARHLFTADGVGREGQVSGGARAHRLIRVECPRLGISHPDTLGATCTRRSTMP